MNINGIREYQTILQARNRSLARFGDGELNLCHGKDARFQSFNRKIGKELRSILKHSPCHVAIPYAHPKGPRRDYWEKYMKGHSRYLNDDVAYGSSFVSRFGEAPWLDNEKYRNELRGLWKGRNVVLARGEGSLTGDMLEGAASVREVIGPNTDAYDSIDSLEEKIGTPPLVILCMGAVATVLADRLARKGLHAIDLGYVGKFL